MPSAVSLTSLASKRRQDQTYQIRDIWIVMVTIKESRPLQRRIVYCDEKCGREFGWSMHWALLVGDRYLERQRTSQSPIPVLKVSAGSAERVASIQRSRRVGVSPLWDDKISPAGRRFIMSGPTHHKITASYHQRPSAEYYVHLAHSSFV